jgi:methionyl aminopeptidase
MIVTRSERELDIMREANQIVVRVHEVLAGLIQPGITTRELDATAETVIREAGAKSAFKGYHGFPACTCISVEEVVVHGIPGPRKLQAGEIVSVDVGVNYRGYIGDAAYTHAVGEIDAERRRLLDATDLALSRAIRAAKAGNYVQDIALAVEGVCKPQKLGIVEDFVGHGVGDQMHLEPQVPNFNTGKRGPRLVEGMVIAIEPMITLGTHRVKVLRDGWTAVTKDGKPAAHFEHSVVVRPDGGEILAQGTQLVWGVRETVGAVN